MSISGNGKLHTTSGEIPVKYEFVESASGISGTVTQIETQYEIPNKFWNLTLKDGSEWTLQKYNAVWDKVSFVPRP